MYNKGEQFPEYLKYTINDKWSRDWIDMSPVQSFSYNSYDIVKNFIKSFPEWENFHSFDSKDWLNRIEHKLKFGFAEQINFENEQEGILKILEEYCTTGSLLEIKIILTVLENWLTKTSIRKVDKQNNRKFITDLLLHLVFGVIRSEKIELTQKLKFTIKIAKEEYFDVDFAPRIFDYWSKIIDEEKIDIFFVESIKSILITYITSYETVKKGTSISYGKNNFSNGHRLISNLINSNIGRAWDVLGIKIKNKFIDYKTEIDNLMIKCFEYDDLLMKAGILYCFQFNAIPKSAWSENGIVGSLITKTLGEENIIEDGRAELVFAILRRNLAVAKEGYYKLPLQKLFRDLIKYKNIKNEDDLVSIICHLFIYYNCFNPDIITAIDSDQNYKFKRSFLKSLVKFSQSYRKEMEKDSKLEVVNLPNPARSKERLKANLFTLIKWQNDYLTTNPHKINFSNENNPVNFDSFFRNTEEFEDVTQLMNFIGYWGIDLLKEMFSNSYQYFIRFHGDDNFFAKIQNLDNPDSDKILLELLSSICKNKIFTFNDRYSLEFIYDALDYLFSKTKIGDESLKILKLVLYDLNKTQKNSAKMLNFINKHKVKILI